MKTKKICITKIKTLGHRMKPCCRAKVYFDLLDFVRTNPILVAASLIKLEYFLPNDRLFDQDEKTNQKEKTKIAEPSGLTTIDEKFNTRYDIDICDKDSKDIKFFMNTVINLKMDKK